MYRTYIAASGFQILLIRRVKHRDILIQYADIFLLKHNTVFAKHFIAVLIVLTILCNLVDEE